LKQEAPAANDADAVEEEELIGAVVAVTIRANETEPIVEAHFWLASFVPESSELPAFRVMPPTYDDVSRQRIMDAIHTIEREVLERRFLPWEQTMEQVTFFLLLWLDLSLSFRVSTRC